MSDRSRMVDLCGGDVGMNDMGGATTMRSREGSNYP